jgi:putative hydrolase of the HAD superfamily
VGREGLHATLDALRERSIALGVVTNGGTEVQTRKLQHMGIADRFAAIVISESARSQKPEPAIFRLALAELHVSADDAWCVGDHPVNDVLGAATAGLVGVWLRGMHAWPQGEAWPEYEIERLPELLGCLDQAARPSVEGDAWPTS